MQGLSIFLFQLVDTYIRTGEKRCGNIYVLMIETTMGNSF